MKRKHQLENDTPKHPETKEQFLKELDEAELKKTNGGIWGTCMNGCGGRCGGCNCSPGGGTTGWW